jgi:hypothetical protein
VPPGKEGKIELRIDNTQGYAGEIVKSANVTTNDPQQPNFNLILRARFKMEPLPTPTHTSVPMTPIKQAGPFVIEPVNRWVTSVLTGNSSASRLYLYNPDAKPVHIKEVVPGGTDFTATLQTIQDGKRYELQVATNPALKPGQYRQAVRIITDNPKQPEMTVELEATIFPRVFAMPTSILMPTLPASSDLSAINWPMIYVRKVREGGLKINSYSSTLPFLKLELATEKEGEIYVIKLKLDQSKIKVGEYKGKVHIETNDPETPVLEIPIKATFN